VTLVGERLLVDGDKLDARIDGRLTSAEHVSTMEGASSLELTIADNDLELLRSGVLTRPGRPNRRQKLLQDFDQAAWARFGAARLELDGAFFRLAGVSGQYDSPPWTITLTFENEIAALMRHMTSPVKWSRGTVTRAEVIHILARRTMRAHGVQFGYFSPQEGQRQPQAKPDTEQATKGIHPNKQLTVQGSPASREQRKNMETVLAVADEEKAGERATLALLEACIQESWFRNLPGGHSSSVGILQLLNIHLGGSTSTNGGRRDVELVARKFLTDGYWIKGGAIKLATRNPDWTPGKIAQNVQGSGADSGDGGTYEQWRAEADAILDAWGGVSRLQVIRERFEFRAGGRRKGETKARDYWTDSGELAEKVRWRRFAHANILWFVSDEYLFQQRPTVILNRGALTPGVLGVTFDADVGLPVSEITLRALTARWSTPAGAVIDVEDLGPLNGRWLTWMHRQNLLRDTSTLTLRRPAPQLKEPAASTRVRQSTETAPESGTPRAEIVKQARKALKQRARYRYRQIRPMPASLFPDNLVEIIEVDCSSFITLVYKAAGIKDPNGRGYDGAGYTGTLAANGKKTTDPQPGDLCFYGDPNATSSHVNLYVGDGKAINMGPSAGLSEVRVKDVRGDFREYRTYDLSDA
jgi:cell wall-associated NlpC family hydrolase